MQPTCARASGRDASTFAAAPRTRLFNQTTCTDGREVFEEEVPVTHVVDMFRNITFGLWFYLARGCSNLTYRMGPTLVAHNRLDAAIQSGLAPPCLGDCVQERLYELKGAARYNVIRSLRNDTFAHAVGDVQACPDEQTRMQAYLYGDIWAEPLIMERAMYRYQSVLLLEQPTGNYLGPVKFHTEVWMLSPHRTVDIHWHIHAYTHLFRCRGVPCKRLWLQRALHGTCLVCDGCTEHCF